MKKLYNTYHLITFSLRLEDKFLLTKDKNISKELLNQNLMKHTSSRVISIVFPTPTDFSVVSYQS